MKKSLSLVLSLIMIITTLCALPFSVHADDTYTVNGEFADPTWGTVTGGGTVAAGESVSLTATTNPGYRFLYWTEYGSPFKDESTITYTPESNRTLYAFAEDPTGLTYSGTASDITFPTKSEGYNGLSGVYVKVSGTGTGTCVFKTSDVTITGTNADCFTISRKYYKGFVPLKNNGSTDFVEITPVFGLEAGTYTATVNIPERDGMCSALTANLSFTVTADYVITANVTGGGGTVTGGGTYSKNETVTLTATPDKNYRFVKWYDSSSLQELSSNATYTFTATQARSICAVFARTHYDIAVSAAPAEGGTVTGAGKYAAGEQVTVTATPNSGYDFVYWLDKHSTRLSDNTTYTFTPNNDIECVAVFTPHVHSTPKTITKTAPTCGKAGNNVYYQCEGCKKYFKDEACTVETTPKAEEIPATGKHTWNAGVITKQPTFYATGVKTYTCSVCNGTTTQTVAKIASPAISKLTKGKKQFKVSWKSVWGIGGYQIQYSLNKNFKKGAKYGTTTKTVKGYKTTSKTYKKLKSKKTYYVRIRGYKVINGKTQYSKWSATKKIKTK